MLVYGALRAAVGRGAGHFSRSSALPSRPFPVSGGPWAQTGEGPHHARGPAALAPGFYWQQVA